MLMNSPLLSTEFCSRATVRTHLDSTTIAAEGSSLSRRRRSGERARERIFRNFSPIEPLNQWKTSNIEHPTSNIECRRDRKFGCSLDVRRWMSDVRCSWRLMESLHDFEIAHWSHEPRRIPLTRPSGTLSP